MHASRSLVRFGRALLVILPFGLTFAQNSYVNFEGKQTRPISLSPDGTRLFAVNTPDARLSVFDVTHPLNPFLIAEIPAGVEPVSVTPRDNDEVWVVNEVSDSVSILSVSRRIVSDTIYVKDEPADVVFAAGKAFISAARNDRIAVFDVNTHAAITNIPVFGENPRALTVNSNGTKIYAAFALSGNRTTLVPAVSAPPQPTNGVPAMRSNLPAPPQVGLIVDAADPAWTNVVRYAMPDNDVVEIDTGTLTVTRYFSRVGTVNLGIAVRPGSGDLYVANTDARNLTHFEPALRGFFVTNRVGRINITSGAVTNFDLNPGYDPTNFTLLDKTNALAQPTAIAFGPSGANYYLAAFGSDRVARVDANSGNITTRIELCPTAIGSASDARNKRGPRGLALKPGAALYVLNRIANTISVIDIQNNTVAREIPIGSFDPTPAAIRNGRGFLYDAKLSGNGTVSCASCHIDAEMDLLAWDLGDPTGEMTTTRTVLPLPPPFSPITNTSAFHPMKGPLTTQTLRGLNGLDPLHWRGDRTNFLQFNGAFASLLGGSTLSAADMAAYRDFVNTIVFQPNPNQNLDRTLPANFAGANPVAGRTAFLTTDYAVGLNCNTCHTAPPGPGTDNLIIPATILRQSQDFKVPQLRNAYQKMSFNNAPGTNSVGGFGFFPNGEDTLFGFMSQPAFVNIRNDATFKNNVSAFVQCFDTGTAPAVGYTRTLVATNLNVLSVLNDWSLLESQALGGANIDLVVKGTLDGVRHGLRFQPGSNNYKPDTTNLPTLTRSQLVAKIQAGDTLTVMGVPPGSGQRMGIDRDLDGVLDADEPLPALQIVQAGASAVINWPFNAVGFNLETAPGLSSPSWSSVTDAVEIVGTRNFVTNVSPGTKFFRLRQP
jgi:YVTN family beta-propeller protein